MGACSSKSPNKYKEASAITSEAEVPSDKAHNIPKPEGLENLEPLDRQLFHLQCMVTVVCQNSQDQWLLVKDSKTDCLNFVTGQANPPEDFFKAAINRWKEQVGVDMLIIGVLNMEYSINAEHNFQRMRAILYTRIPNEVKRVQNKKKNGNTGKQVKKMLSQEIIKEYEAGGNIDKEVYNWVKYAENKGVIYPLTIVAKEGSRIKKNELNIGSSKEK